MKTVLENKNNIRGTMKKSKKEQVATHEMYHSRTGLMGTAPRLIAKNYAAQLTREMRGKRNR